MKDRSLWFHFQQSYNPDPVRLWIQMDTEAHSKLLPTYTKSEACAAICTSEILSWSRFSSILVKKSGRSVVLFIRLVNSQKVSRFTRAAYPLIRLIVWASWVRVSSISFFMTPGIRVLNTVAKKGNRLNVSARAPCLNAFVTRPIHGWNFADRKILADIITEAKNSNYPTPALRTAPQRQGSRWYRRSAS